MKAGRKKSRKSRRGGSVLVNAAVPAALIYALNKKYGKRKGGRKKTRRGGKKRSGKKRRGKRRRGGSSKMGGEGD